MDDNRYWLAGKVNVPEDKKPEFNACVMKILNRFGMRKRKEIDLAGDKITILEKPTPDENGIVSFDYSIFEKKKRDVSTYNTNTCELNSVDRVENEYGLAMNCILLLQECYSNGSCFFMEKRKPVDVYVYMCLLSTILNKKIYNNGREKIWDMLLLLRKTPDTDLPSEQDIFQSVFPFGYSQFEHFQLLSMLVVDDTEPPKTDKNPITDKLQIPEATYIAQREYLYRIMAEEHQRDKKRLEGFLKKLLRFPLPDREKLAEENDNLGIIAELSLYVPPTCIVSAFALLEKKPFWDAWDELVTERSYTDIIEEEDDKEEKLSEKWVKVPFKKIIFREDEDEFLEFWDGENLMLSDEMKERIQMWKRLIDEQEDQLDLQVKPYLGETLAYIEKEWPCRYIDEMFVEKILYHQDDPAWRRVLLVLRRIVDDGIDLFPEMNRKMAVLWLKLHRMSFDATAIVAFCSLMANDVARQQVFGF